MTARVTAGLRAVQAVASRPDPTQALSAGAIARTLGMGLSSVSRLCAELVEAGMLARGPAYGSYLPGPVALSLSGQAVAPFAQVVRTALTRIAQRTGETALLAAPSDGGMLVTAAVVSPWTLYSPAAVGEYIDDQRSAVWQAGKWADDGGASLVEATVGQSVEVAAPVLEPSGASVAVLAIRLPVNRAKQGVPVARRAVADARRELERVLAVSSDVVTPGADSGTGPTTGALPAAVALLRALAAGASTISALAAATGLRRDRASRLIESCRRAGLVRVDPDTGAVHLAWVVHGWLRAAVAPTLVDAGAPLVARVADETGVCAFITVLRGMRSVTLVEELRDLGEGLEMTPWLGRPCPILSADGGPILVMDFSDEDILAFLPKRVDARETEEFLERARTVARDGVMTRESFEEAGQTAISAPIRDASGTVAAAACLIGASDAIRRRTDELEAVARRMAGELSHLLGHRELENA